MVRGRGKRTSDVKIFCNTWPSVLQRLKFDGSCRRENVTTEIRSRWNHRSSKIFLRDKKPTDAENDFSNRTRSRWELQNHHLRGIGSKNKTEDREHGRFLESSRLDWTISQKFKIGLGDFSKVPKLPGWFLKSSGLAQVIDSSRV